jgi:hypothetical protein
VTAIYRITVRNGGKRHFVEGKWNDEKEARRGARRRFAGKTSIDQVKVLKRVAA